MVTTQRVRRELGFGPTAVGLDESAFASLVNDLVDRERERVADAIDVSLGTETVTEALERPDHVDGQYFPLPERPVQSVTSVSIDTDRAGGVAVDVDTDVAVHESHLELLPDADRDAWPTDRRSITVEWTHGYPEDDTPDVVEGAIIGLVRHSLQEIDSDGVTNESIDGQSVTYEPGEAVISRHLSRANQFDEPDFYGGANVV